MKADPFHTPLSQVQHVIDGQFFDTDGSIYVLPPNVCKDLDDDCTLDKMCRERRIGCADYNRRRGKCPFVPD